MPQHSRRPIGLVAAFGLALAAALAPAENAGAVTRIEKTFGSWAVVCIENDDLTKRCSMLQQRADQQTRRVVFVWAVLADAELKLSQSLTVPAGVSIKEGIRLFIGEAEPITLPYDTCGPRVCVASLPLDDTGVAGIGGAEKASASYVQAGKRLIQVNLDTAGFSDALAYLRSQLQ